MIKCPFCHKDNEDGALFCEQCTSDLSSVAPSPAASSGPPPIKMAEPVPMAMAEPIFAEALPMVMAEPIEAEAIPLMAEPIEAEAYPMAEAEPMAMPALELAEPIVKAEPPPPAPMLELPPSRPAPAPVAPAPAPSPITDAPGAGGGLPSGAQPRLLVLRGQKRNIEYPIYEGDNYIGRADEKPVDIDLEEQEPPDRIWCSRQHARVGFENNTLVIEDLNSANGTYVNRTRVYPGQIRTLAVNDVVQIGNVQLKVLA